MTTAPVEQEDLPPFTNQSARCPRCAGRGPIRVHFDRDCAEAGGDHFHRVCPSRPGSLVRLVRRNTHRIGADAIAVMFTRDSKGTAAINAFLARLKRDCNGCLQDRRDDRKQTDTDHRRRAQRKLPMETAFQAVAVRIRARAIRRCGELLAALERPQQGGRPTQNNGGGGPPVSRAQAARDAGLSRDQKREALRLARVPADEFDAAAGLRTPGARG
jgi:hypothetical protein